MDRLQPGRPYCKMHKLRFILAGWKITGHMLNLFDVFVVHSLVVNSNVDT